MVLVPTPKSSLSSLHAFCSNEIHEVVELSTVKVRHKSLCFLCFCTLGGLRVGGGGEERCTQVVAVCVCVCVPVCVCVCRQPPSWKDLGSP